MRRYTITVNGTEHTVDVDELSADTFLVELDGQQAEVHLVDHQDLDRAEIAPQLEVAPPTNGLARHGRVTPAPASPPARSAPPMAPAPAEKMPAARGSGPATGLNLLTAPMPGVVLSIAVTPGAAVRRGQVLLVLEAMKMKNELRAPRDAVVADIKVEAGQQVAHGDPLIAFEAG